MVSQMSDSEITFRDIEVSDDEYASSEIINSDVAVVPKKIKQSINTIYQWTTFFFTFYRSLCRNIPE